MSFLIMLSFVFILGSVLLGLGLSLALKVSLDREKSSPFECGFNPSNVARLPFSLRFFLVAVVFLIFDVELVLIFPVVVSSSGANPIISMALLMTFVLILTLGLYHEANQGSLDWVK